MVASSDRVVCPGSLIHVTVSFINSGHIFLPTVHKCQLHGVNIHSRIQSEKQRKTNLQMSAKEVALVYS